MLNTSMCKRLPGGALGAGGNLQQKQSPPQCNAKPNPKLKLSFVKAGPRKLGTAGPLHTATADTAIFLGIRSVSSPC